MIKFKDRVQETLSHKFRTDNDFHRAIVTYYLLAQHKSIKKVVNKFHMWDTIKYLFTGKRDAIYTTINNERKVKKISKSKANLFCLNDGEKATDEDRRRTKEILNKLFPKKSSFEK